MGPGIHTEFLPGGWDRDSYRISSCRKLGEVGGGGRRTEVYCHFVGSVWMLCSLSVSQTIAQGLCNDSLFCEILLSELYVLPKLCKLYFWRREKGLVWSCCI